MKRAGFTMIELIFVIVILGILAAVAVPKLAATRSDAAATKALSDYKTVIKDIQNYAIAQGANPAALITATTASPSIVASGNDINILGGTGITCASIARTSATTVTIAAGAQIASTECLQIGANYTVGVLNVSGTAVTR